MTSYGHKIDNIEISVELSEDGEGWAAQAWFPGNDGATYKEYGFGDTEQEAVDAAVAEVKLNWRYQKPAEPAFDNDHLSDAEEAALAELNRVDDPTAYAMLKRRGFIEVYDVGDKGVEWYRHTKAGSGYLRAKEAESVTPQATKIVEALTIVNLIKQLSLRQSNQNRLDFAPDWLASQMEQLTAILESL